MPTHYPQLHERVRRQADLLPELYGELDFDSQPYRTTTDPDDLSSLRAKPGTREALLADDAAVELISTATWLGDVVADSYAALMGRYSVTELIGMLKTACRKGIDAVPDAPDELAALIADMEVIPDWLDMDLVRRGAEESQLPMALLAPFVVRGSFIATFINTYAALPMALTGALSGKRAARRVNETTSFFTVTTLPGALDRHGPGFEAAAMVRLMHSMVRFNALKRSPKWDVAVYGMPIPQVDQMPAGMINLFLMAMDARREGRTEFTESERAVVEFTHYRNFLLGLPEELLPRTPEEIIRVLTARAALLRDDFDDATCGEMVRSTMAAYLRPNDTLRERIADSVEKSYSKLFFVRMFSGGKKDVAAKMGVTLSAGDYARAAVCAPFILGRIFVVQRAMRVPALRGVTNAYLQRLLKYRLATYGAAEFTSDASEYTPSGRAA
ncbi:oxygenase MpaB family protein [[Mycobacterium] kokjensenii]|uniref:Oxygenase MpaB family protein n=1 Tax=[Mycobacterium] kokjensenii TaxID=3064287 RepID=A0ABM9L6F2_9MYCO|nr:oxygenase MpaB family protein [Mycolicibacter sp. MU0083]CAJ1493143.1 oxygenase MpaB family protein [Mycolicibacter sp. MU0083]